MFHRWELECYSGVLYTWKSPSVLTLEEGQFRSRLDEPRRLGDLLCHPGQIHAAGRSRNGIPGIEKGNIMGAFPYFIQ